MHPEPETEARPHHTPRRRRALVAAVVVSVVGAGAALGYRHTAGSRALPRGLIQLNGRIEGDAITIATKQPGRLVALAVREGATVRAGQTLASLDDVAARARLAQSVAARDVAVARADTARAELALLRKQLPLGVASAEAALQVAEASLARTRMEERQAAREQARSRTLGRSGAIDRQTTERSDLVRDSAVQAVASASAARTGASSALGSARLGPDQLSAKAASIVALDAMVRQAQAVVDEAQSALDDLTIASPAAGTITTRFVDLGEIINAGTPMFQLVDLDRLYVKAFVPESDVGKVRLGMPARVYTDAFPERPLEGQVRFIASRAEFTPREVQTRDERVKLVYVVKIYVDDNRRGQLVPGLVADAVVRWQEDAPWAAPR